MGWTWWTLEPIPTQASAQNGCWLNTTDKQTDPVKQKGQTAPGEARWEGPAGITSCYLVERRELASMS